MIIDKMICNYLIFSILYGFEYPNPIYRTLCYFKLQI